MEKLAFVLLLSACACAEAGQIVSNARFDATYFEKSAHRRTKRAVSLPTKYTSVQIEQIVKVHNDYRKKQGASDMELMFWNDELAKMAQTWSDNCNLDHGQPANTSPFKSVGQNLFWTSGKASDTGAVTSWYNEIKDYDYVTNKCSRVCGHYTQVVWAKSKYVGCGVTTCTPQKGGKKTQGDYVVCNYGEAGNLVGAKPFQKGSACTACRSGKFFCKDSMCDNCFGQTGCSCNALCYNCGVKDTTTCTCKCVDGWRGNTCQDVCKNSHKNCGANPGWPVSWCDNDHSYVLTNCPLMCSLCKAPGKNTPTNCPTPQQPTNPTKPDSCKDVTCINGGTPTPSGSSCSCKCTPDWQGKRCTESTAQATVGVVITVKTTMQKFTSMVWPKLAVQVVSAVTDLCHTKQWYQPCCPGSTTIPASLTPSMTYMTLNELKIGDGFPQEDTGYVTTLLYVTPLKGNALCSAAPKRRKRATDGFLSQKALYEAIDNKKTTIDKELKQCCDVTFTVTPAQADSAAPPIVTSIGLALAAFMAASTLRLIE